MPLHLPTFFTRTASAIVFAIVMMAGFLWVDRAFLVLLLLIQFLCIGEYFKLMAKIVPDLGSYFLVQRITQATGFLTLIAFTIAVRDDSYRYKVVIWPALLFLPSLILMVSTLLRSNPRAGLVSFGALMYISLPLLLLLDLRSISLIIPLALILMIWTNDTMAYIVGSIAGRHPMSKISPKKTWEGTIGGIALTVGGAALWGYFSEYYQMRDWIVLALIVGITGTLGDLLESKLKRLAEVKDSGNIMPGHGGALDRFDSLLVSTPFAFAYAYLFMPPLPLVIFSI